MASLEWPYAATRRGYNCTRAVLVPILEMRTFDFSTADVRGNITIVLSPALCVLNYHRLRLAVRVHAFSLDNTNQYVSFAIQGTMPSDEDPAVEFLSTTTLLTLQLDSGTSIPSLVTATATDLDAYVKITLTGYQGVGVDPMSATLSACLLLSDH